MKARVLIKGSYDGAVAAMERHGVKMLDHLGADGGCTSFSVESDVDTLNKWLCEEPMQAPYPAGTMLHWAEYDSVTRQ